MEQPARPKLNPSIDYAREYGIMRAQSDRLLEHANKLEAYATALEAQLQELRDNTMLTLVKESDKEVAHG